MSGISFHDAIERQITEQRERQLQGNAFAFASQQRLSDGCGYDAFVPYDSKGNADTEAKKTETETEKGTEKGTESGTETETIRGTHTTGEDEAASTSSRVTYVCSDMLSVSIMTQDDTNAVAVQETEKEKKEEEEQIEWNANADADKEKGQEGIDVNVNGDGDGDGDEGACIDVGPDTECERERNSDNGNGHGEGCKPDGSTINDNDRVASQSMVSISFPPHSPAPPPAPPSPPPPCLPLPPPAIDVHCDDHITGTCSDSMVTVVSVQLEGKGEGKGGDNYDDDDEETIFDDMKDPNPSSNPTANANADANSTTKRSSSSSPLFDSLLVVGMPPGSTESVLAASSSNHSNGLSFWKPRIMFSYQGHTDHHQNSVGDAQLSSRHLHRQAAEFAFPRGVKCMVKPRPTAKEKVNTQEGGGGSTDRKYHMHHFTVGPLNGPFHGICVTATVSDLTQSHAVVAQLNAITNTFTLPSSLSEGSGVNLGRREAEIEMAEELEEMDHGNLDAPYRCPVCQTPAYTDGHSVFECSFCGSRVQVPNTDADANHRGTHNRSRSFLERASKFLLGSESSDNNQENQNQNQNNNSGNGSPCRSPSSYVARSCSTGSPSTNSSSNSKTSTAANAMAGRRSNSFSKLANVFSPISMAMASPKDKYNKEKNDINKDVEMSKRSSGHEEPSATAEASSTNEQQVVQAQWCWLLLTRKPLHELHFSFLCHLLKQIDVGRQMHMDHTRAGNTDKAMDDTDTDMDKRITMARLLTQLLDKYFNLEMVAPSPSAPHNLLLFQLPTIDNKVIEYMYSCRGCSSDFASAVTEWMVAATFRALSVQHIIAVLNYLCLEHPVAVVSTRLDKLSAITLSFVSLLAPLVFQNTVVPILPISMADLLHAPVPFIVGSPVQMHGKHFEHILWIIVDKDELKLPNHRAEPLPGSATLCAKLMPLQHQLLSLSWEKQERASGRCCQSQLFVLLRKERLLVQDIMGILRGYFGALLSDLQKCLHEDLMETNRHQLQAQAQTATGTTDTSDTPAGIESSEGGRRADMDAEDGCYMSSDDLQRSLRSKAYIKKRTCHPSSQHDAFVEKIVGTQHCVSFLQEGRQQGTKD